MTPADLAPWLAVLAIVLGLALAAGVIGGRRAVAALFGGSLLLLGLPLLWSTWVTPPDPRVIWQQRCFNDLRRLESVIELYNIDHATSPLAIATGPVPLAELQAGGYLPPRLGCGEGLASLPGEPGTYTLLCAPPDPRTPTQPWHIRCTRHGHPAAPLALPSTP